jgi:ribosomal protein S19E (S16A)
MDFEEKAKIRLEHWITHNDHHEEEYREFAEQLEAVGWVESAKNVREMITLSAKGTTALRKALDSLGSKSS